MIKKYKFLIFTILSIFLITNCESQETNSIIQKDSSVLSNDYNIPCKFFFGGKFNSIYINSGLDVRKKNWLSGYGLIFYQYDFTTRLYYFTLGRTRTNLFAINVYRYYKYASLIKKRINFYIGPELNLTYSRVIFNDSLQKKILPPILGPILFLTNEIDFKISKNVYLTLEASLGYGNGFINSGLNSNNDGILTDREKGYGEFRFKYGLRFPIH